MSNIIQRAGAIGVNAMQFINASIDHFGAYSSKTLETEVRLHLEALDPGELYELFSHLKHTVKRNPLFALDVFDIEGARTEIREIASSKAANVDAKASRGPQQPRIKGDLMEMVRKRVSENKDAPIDYDDGIFTTCRNGHKYYGSACRQCIHLKNGTEE